MQKVAEQEAIAHPVSRAVKSRSPKGWRNEIFRSSSVSVAAKRVTVLHRSLHNISHSSKHKLLRERQCHAMEVRW